MGGIRARAAVYFSVLVTTAVVGCADARREGTANPNQMQVSESSGSPATGAGGVSGSTTTLDAGVPNQSLAGPQQCVAAGGRCLLGNRVSSCAEMGPFDCNPQRNPGGAFCCLKEKPAQSSMPEAAGAGGAAPVEEADGGKAEEAPDYACTEDADCVIKDVGNCCGAYPRCVNRSSPTPPPFCPPGLGSVCGWPDIDACKCKENRCRSMQGDREV